jgi:1,4-dihydroxy-6-naphthoate synthase
MAKIRIAYTPDSDDAFTFCAWQHGHIDVPLNGIEVEFHRGHIRENNEAAGRQEFDVVAVSSAAYPMLADNYRILAAGTSVGRGWGPIIASKNFSLPDQLAGKRIGVGGHPTTGSTLALMYCPPFEPIPMAYDQIVDAITAGTIDAGVMIHEELLHFPKLGLTRVLDLGQAWDQDTGTPLPIGLNIIHRRIDDQTASAIATACQRSLNWANKHRDQAMAFAGQFGRGEAEEHVSMFSNHDTLCLPLDVREAIRIMCDRVESMGLGPHVETIDFVDGEQLP